MRNDLAGGRGNGRGGNRGGGRGGGRQSSGLNNMAIPEGVDMSEVLRLGMAAAVNKQNQAAANASG